MPFIEYENDNLPFTNLPYEFKSRLINLSSTIDIPKLREICPDIKPICHRRRKFDKCTNVFISDNKKVYDAARREIDAKMVQNFYSRFQCIRYIFDGPLTFDPRWDSIIHVDELDENKPIVVQDTLILHCKSFQVYEKVIPLIIGRYSRLILYGEITWEQAKKLLHAHVKQVRIEGRICLNLSEYDDFVEYVQHFCHRFMDK
uniref:F-box domain-containing protein n=1 Tax=Panagrellus redivivus TaxID=6233 RepID=A0A7E4VMW9_PANRE